MPLSTYVAILFQRNETANSLKKMNLKGKTHKKCITRGKSGITLVYCNKNKLY